MYKNFEGLNHFENTGSRLEEEFFGSVNTKKYKELAYQYLHKEELVFDGLSQDEKLEKAILLKERASQSFNKVDDFIGDGYIKRDDAMKIVEKCQIGNPEQPNGFFAKALHKKLAEEAFSKEQFIVKYFTATGGTHLDVAHKIDCFFKLYFKSDGSEIACATIDVTQNSKKNSTDADLLINISPDEKDLYDSSKNNEKFNKTKFDSRITDIVIQIQQALLNDYRKKFD